MTTAAVRWIDSTSWELPFFGLPQHIPWPEDVDPAVANQDPFEVGHLLRAIELLGSEASEPWSSFLKVSPQLEELAEALEDNEIGQASRLLDEVEAIYPGTPFVLFHRAYVARREGRDDDALAHYQAAAEKTPQIAAVWNNIGSLHAARGQRDEAVAAFKKALQASPNDNTALEGLTALREVVKLRAADPRHKDAVAYVDVPTFRNMAGQQIESMASNPDQLLAYGEQLLRDGLVPEVGLQALQKAAEVRPNDPRTLFGLGSAYRISEQPEKARETFTRYTEVQPEDPHGFFNLAQTCNAMGDQEGERAALERTLEIDPNFHAALGIRFQLSPTEHDPAKEEALEKFGKERNSWMAFVLASAVARTRGDSKSALRQAERALEVNPESEDVLLHYAAALGDAREIGKLATVVKPAVESGKYSKRLDWNYAQVLHELDLTKDAIAVLRKASADAPDDFKNMADTMIDAWTGLLTGCGVRIETHPSGFLTRPILISLPDGDGGILINSGSQLPAQAGFPWRASSGTVAVALQQGETGSGPDPRALGVFRVFGIQPPADGAGHVTIRCEIAVMPDGTMHFRANQNGQKLKVQWAPPGAAR